LPLPATTLLTTTDGSTPAFATICLKGSSTARSTIRIPASWSAFSPLTLAIASRARIKATPPPATIPSSTAALVA